MARAGAGAPCSTLADLEAQAVDARFLCGAGPGGARPGARRADATARAVLLPTRVRAHPRAFARAGHDRLLPGASHPRWCGLAPAYQPEVALAIGCRRHRPECSRARLTRSACRGDRGSP